MHFSSLKRNLLEKEYDSSLTTQSQETSIVLLKSIQIKHIIFNVCVFECYQFL